MVNYGKIWRLILVIGVLVLSDGPKANAGAIEDANAAYFRGDHATAIRLFRPLADQGDALAQIFLGNMYVQGLPLQLPGDLRVGHLYPTAK